MVQKMQQNDEALITLTSVKENSNSQSVLQGNNGVLVPPRTHLQISTKKNQQTAVLTLHSEQKKRVEENDRGRPGELPRRTKENPEPKTRRRKIILPEKETRVKRIKRGQVKGNVKHTGGDRRHVEEILLEIPLRKIPKQDQSSASELWES